MSLESVFSSAKKKISNLYFSLKPKKENKSQEEFQDKFPFIMILTGAGISAPSGIPTFTGNNSKPSIPMSFMAFLSDKKGSLSYFDQRRKESKDKKPNSAHFALARLESEWPGRFLLVTSNVDQLHEAAGSKNVLHIHGHLNQSVCMMCGHKAEQIEDMANSPRACVVCGSLDAMRPDVVLFGEIPKHLKEIYDAVDRCDILLVIGTSLEVRPASLLPIMARRNCNRDFRNGKPECRVIEININLTGSLAFNETIKEDVVTAVPRWVSSELLNLKQLENTFTSSDSGL